MTIKIKRIYNSNDDWGIRILIDRVWPRGVSKTEANIDYWIKNIAPTTELRKWFNHDPKLYESFKEKYKKELRENTNQKDALKQLNDIINNNDQNILLLFGAKDTKHNHAIVLKEFLEEMSSNSQN